MNTSEIHIFVSYSRFDQFLVTPIVQLIRAIGGSIFQDVDSIPPGKRWKPVIEDSLDQASVVLVFWCAHSRSSKEVRAEWEQAILASRDVVPTRLDDTPLDEALAEFQSIDIRALAAGHLSELTDRDKLLPGEADLTWHRFFDAKHGNHLRHVDTALIARSAQFIYDFLVTQFGSKGSPPRLICSPLETKG